MRMILAKSALRVNRTTGIRTNGGLGPENNASPVWKILCRRGRPYCTPRPGGGEVDPDANSPQSNPGTNRYCVFRRYTGGKLARLRLGNVANRL